MNRLTSFSQNNMFSICKRWWFYSYIKKIPAISDMCYANAGTVVHKCLQSYYDKKTTDIESLKQLFNTYWDSFKLDDTKLKLKKDSYYLMVINGKNLNLEITSTELKIINADAVAYLDIVNTNKHIIIDWKTSTRSEENEEEYKKQLQFYQYLYKLKFDVIPEAVVYYLKYNCTKGEMKVQSTVQDIMKIEEWHYNIQLEMNMIIESKKIPEKCTNCGIWCPYKNICNDDGSCLKFTLHYIGNYIQIDGIITELLNKGLIKNFSYELKDAYFIKKNNPHANTTINFWNLNKQLLPIGFKDKLIKVLRNYAEYMKKELIIDVEEHREFDKTIVAMPDKFINGKTLRDYQEEAVITFKRNKIAQIEAATGSGKTEVAIELIRQIGYKTLFLVNKIELLNQTKQRIEESLGIKVGKIGQGDDDIQEITVGTIQTIHKNIKKYSSYLQNIRFVIFDECHHIPSSSYWQISNHLTNTEYRAGLTATSRRDDGNDMYIEAVTGSICYNINSKTLIDKGYLTKPKIIFIKDYLTKEEDDEIEAKCKIGLINETPNYSNYYKGFISENSFRNNQILEVVKKEKNKKILILVKLVEHGILLNNMIEGSKYFHGETNKEDRQNIMVEFKDGKLNVLIGTYSIFSEGIDVPILDVAINGTANKGDIKSIQMLGRIMRLFEGKGEARFYDFIDSTKFFYFASRARMKIFREQEHDIEVIEKLKS